MLQHAGSHSTTKPPKRWLWQTLQNPGPWTPRPSLRIWRSLRSAAGVSEVLIFCGPMADVWGTQ